MRRREFLGGIGSSGVGWPLAAQAQEQGRLPVVGVLRPNPKETEPFAEPFRRYMRAIGWEEGRNVRFLFVWAEGHNERAPALAEELVRMLILSSPSETLPSELRNARPKPAPSSA